MRYLFSIIIIMGVVFLGYSYSQDSLNYFLGRTPNRFEHGQCLSYGSNDKIEFVVGMVEKDHYQLIKFKDGKLDYILKPEVYSEISYVNQHFKRLRCDFKPFSLGRDLKEQEDADRLKNLERYNKDVN